ncbi:hypothetical protein SEA_HITCHHIKER_56 [Microbacterium phage HitchHiker]|nr:hypothetical protein SEA_PINEAPPLEPLUTO_56 [Microbacterium phage PineapplePluto]
MEKTPLEKLDDALYEFVKETLGGEDAPALHGWTLAFETSRISTEENAFPLATSQHYSFGPSTTPSQALGLHRYGGSVLETYLVNQTLNND